MGISHRDRQEDKTNEEYGRRSQIGCRMGRYDIVRGGKLLDTPYKRGNAYGFHSSYGFEGHHHHQFHHPYMRSGKVYFPKVFKKEKPPTFDGEMKKSEYVEAWWLGMKNFFRFHDYLENMKSKIASSNLKGKENIWWQDVKHVRGIREEELIWDMFEILFKRKFLSEIYYDENVKDFYELNMCSMQYDD